ncbi:ATP-binding protein [Lentzea cavernae]|uniref:Transcriptional regulator, LuxR family protein n=1 Tax=Lentzea cavernae TaxID=2020703 RepID=A0ABQ3MF74_9PSEU|nr:LuxR family transcriptional regulator [Lentzea cavernae]GHH40728.1 putative transcriptional regulator, LuxR family protein [Lentzea cavernae]
MADSGPRPGLRGRRGETEVLDRLLVEARAGRSQVLVLRGEAGIGKSALVDHVVRGAAGFRIARAAGVESEMELAFAALHQLFAPMMTHVDRLPEPQRAALTVAFGLSTGSAPDRFLVGLAVLSLLAEVTEEQPLVCVVDDAQWLDRVSAQTLAFVARRLLAERVVFVFAVRSSAGDDQLAGLRELVVRGLPDRDARDLLDSVVLGRVDERVKDRIVAEAQGNPLALLELPRGLTGAELAGGFARPDVRPLASQIEQSFLRRIGSLPDTTQRLLLAAAAEPVGDVSLLRRVAERLGIGAEAAAAAEAAGLIKFGARVLFRHPLVRSAAYRAADSDDRRDVHRALAAATDPESDPDRRAWHRAHAAVEPDEAVAGELELSAGRAQARGGIAAAAAFLTRAAGLTPDPARRGARVLAAAHATFEAGAPDAALELLAAAEIGPLDALQRGRLARLRAQIAFARRRGGDALPLLFEAAGRLEDLDGGQAREVYLEAIGAAVFAGRLGESGALAEVARAALSAPPGPLPARPVDALLDGLGARFAGSYGEGAPLLRQALLAFRQEAAQDGEETMRWLWLAWLTAADLWDDEAWHDLVTHAVRTARETGALHFLPLALSYRAVVHLHAGEFDLASTLVEESDAILKVTGNSHLGYPRVALLAWRGDPETPSALRAGARWASTWGEGRAIGGRGFLNAVLYNGLGRHEDALASAAEACEHDDLGLFGFALVELVEAAARTGAPAAEALARIEERATASGTQWASGVLALARALLTDDPDAEPLYRKAIEHLGRTRVAVYLARAHLLYGEWLAREDRQPDAREQLRTAHEMLHRFGANAFAERARRALAAAGEAVHQHAPRTREELTAQEAQIARLASDGRTNSEIGAELFLSHRTVEWHLRKVFTKLDVASRRDLRDALADG